MSKNSTALFTVSNSAGNCFIPITVGPGVPGIRDVSPNHPDAQITEQEAKTVLDLVAEKGLTDLKIQPVK